MLFRTKSIFLHFPSHAWKEQPSEILKAQGDQPCSANLGVSCELVDVIGKQDIGPAILVSGNTEAKPLKVMSVILTNVPPSSKSLISTGGLKVGDPPRGRLPMKPTASDSYGVLANPSFGGKVPNRL